jgi:hypothetical protein
LESFQFFVRVLTCLDQKIINRSLFKVVILLLFEEKNYFIDAGTLLIYLVIKKRDLAFDGRVV